VDIIVNLFEVPPGASVAKHIHPGEEIVYVIDGGTIREPDGNLVAFEAGHRTDLLPRHPTCVTVVGDKNRLKMLNVFVVDKQKPLRELA
jgi:hypothetical protein